MIQKVKKNLFILVILLIGLVTIVPYGFYLDQDLEQLILYSNIKEYLLRLPGEMPLLQDLSDFGVVEVSKFYDRDHGVALYYPAFMVWYINQASPYAGNLFWHAYTFLLVFWGISSLFFLAKKMYQNEKIAGFITLLFFLTPRMFAESHYNNKDMVLLSMTFCMLYYGFCMMENLSWKNIFLFALTGAFAANIKIIGVWIFGILGIYILVYYIASGQFNKNILGKVFLCIGVWAGIFLIITPACWGNVVEFFIYLIRYAVNYSRWTAYMLFDGEVFRHDLTGMPREYLPTMILLTVPVIILLLSVLGGIACVVTLLRKRSEEAWKREGYVFTSLIIGAIPAMFAVVQASPLYNGWRHFSLYTRPLLWRQGIAVIACGVGPLRCRKRKFFFGAE